MTIGALTKDALVAARYASRAIPLTLYHGNDIPTLKRLYSAFEDPQMLPGDAPAT